MSTLVISTSLNPSSRSRLLARHAFEWGTSQGRSLTWCDLREYSLPLCDGNSAYACAEVTILNQLITHAQSILLATPIYTYSVGSSAKNLIELTGKAWSKKPVGLLCAAGGKNSYMAPLSLANALMLDYRCPIIPKYVYTDGTGFDGDRVLPEIALRIEELVRTTVHWGDVLREDGKAW